MSNAIEILDLKKQYKGGLEALKGISLTVEKGDFFGLLGPNGAGKSTTIGILCGLVNKTSGTVSVGGYNIDSHPNDAKLHLGVVPQEFNFNIFETCYQIVINQAGYYGVPARIAQKRIDMLFEKLGLTDKKHVSAMRLSGGLKRRLMIARALVHEPEILILDEPTAGVDISLRRSMWTFLEELNHQGTTIILTTHYLEEAESLCKKIAIIDKGRLIANRPTNELLKQLQSETLIMYTQDTLSQAPKIDGASTKWLDDHSFEIEIDQDDNLTQIIGALTAQNVTISRIKNKANRLEELFIKLVEDPK